MALLWLISVFLTSWPWATHRRGPGLFVLSVPLVNLPAGMMDGQFTISVVVMDKAGNTADSINSGIAILDSQLPVAEIDSPLQGTTVHGADVTISASVCRHGAGWCGSFNGSSYTGTETAMPFDVTITAGGDTQVSYYAAGLTDGLHNVTLDIVDLAGECC